MSRLEQAGIGFFNGKAHLPFPTGKYSVGCVDLLAPSSSSSSFLVFRLFYPTSSLSSSTSENSDRWTKWLPRPEYAEGYLRFKFGQWRIPFMSKFFSWLIRDPYIPVSQDSPILRRAAASGNDQSSSAWPLVVFSHGMGSCRTTYSRLCYEIASRGFCVAALEHMDGSASIALNLSEDGEESWIPELKLDPSKPEVEIRYSQVEQRVAESESVLRVLSNFNDGKTTTTTNSCLEKESEFNPGTELRDNLDLTNPIICGHSFGGSTVVTALAKGNFKVGIAYDAWLFPVSQHLPSIQDKKILFLNNEGFQGSKNLKLMSNFEGENNVWTMKKTNHYVQSDIPTIFQGLRISPNWLYLAGTSRHETEEVFSPEKAHGMSVRMFETFVSGSSDLFEKCIADNEVYLLKGTKYKQQ